MSEKLDEEMKEAYGKFIDYTVDHIFDTNDNDVKKNARILYDNYDKAYGETGSKGLRGNFSVPPYSTLIFEVRLIDVVNY